MDYRWIISHAGSDYAWALLDQNGERVSSGIASSRAEAMLAAERARVKIRETASALDRPETNENSG
jgi:hypothetical protein